MHTHDPGILFPPLSHPIQFWAHTYTILVSFQATRAGTRPMICHVGSSFPYTLRNWLYYEAGPVKIIKKKKLNTRMKIAWKLFHSTYHFTNWVHVGDGKSDGVVMTGVTEYLQPTLHHRLTDGSAQLQVLWRLNSWRTPTLKYCFLM